MTMTYSKSGLELTESFEGCCLAAYTDVAGVWTIGYGHTGSDVYDGLTITQSEAEGLLLHDIQHSVNCVNNAVTETITQSEFDALVDFVFNVGCGAFLRSTMLRLINQGDFSESADQFQLWDHAGGKVVAGLFRRRQAEALEFSGENNGL